MNKNFKIVGFIFLLATSSCGGSLSTNSAATDTSSSAPTSTSDDAFLFATDFSSSGQIFSTQAGRAAALDNQSVTGLGSSAVIRSFGGKIYVLHDGYSVFSSDNLQVLDPTDSWKTLAQFSVGNGANPHDVVVEDGMAYISLYSPEQSKDQKASAGGSPADVIKMNPLTGEIIKYWSFKNYLNGDSSQTARAHKLLLSGNFLYVTLQDLEGNSFSHNASGKIGIINLITGDIVAVKELLGRNPVDLSLSESTQKLFVALQAPYDSATGNFNNADSFGGVEVVTVLPDGTLGASQLIDDEKIGTGGYVERVAVDESNDQLYAEVSRMNLTTFEFTSEIVRWSLSSVSDSTDTIFVPDSSDVREMAVSPTGQLWIARRKIAQGAGKTTSPSVDVFDNAGNLSRSMTPSPLVPITSITFK